VRAAIKPILKFFEARSASILAVSSVVIAGCSLYLTITAQREDRAYKELLIKPSIAIQTHATDFSVEFANEGLGPAEIKAVAYQFGGKCLSLLDDDGTVSKTQYDEASAGIRQRLLTDIFNFEIPNTPGTLVNIRTSLLLPKSILAAGGKHVIFRIDDTSLELFRSKVNALDLPLRQSILDKFTGMALTIPISIKYCSMSGKYCQTNIHDDFSGKRCALS
jgi:hypothetical protein